MLRLFVWLVLLFQSHRYFSAHRGPTKHGPVSLALAAPTARRSSAAWVKRCEVELPKALTSDQRAAFCDGLSVDEVGPSVACANEARAQLKYKYEDIYSLCHGAAGVHPVACLSALSMKDRSDVGPKLCTRSESDFTADCWKSLMPLVNKNAKKNAALTDVVIDFCQTASSPLVVDCVRTALIEHPSADVSAVTSRCHLTLAGRSQLDTPHRNGEEYTDGMKACLRTLKPNIVSSTERSGQSISKDPQKSMVFVEDAIEFCAAAMIHPHSLECYKASGELTLSITDRLRLCYGVDSAEGPVQCMSHLLSTYSSLAFSSEHVFPPTLSSPPPVSAARTALGVQLCSTAQSSSPAICFAEGIRLQSMLGVFEEDSIFAAASPKRSAMKRGAEGMDDSNSRSSTSGFNLIDAMLAAYDFTAMDNTLLVLCQGTASPSGPVDCYRESQSAFRPAELKSETTMSWYHSRVPKDEKYDHTVADINSISREVRMQLCLSAVSEAPAHCASKAPHWLSVSERLDLCSLATDGQEPLRCMQSIEAPSKRFHKTPTKMLGYFLESVFDDDAKYLRSQLIHLCSYLGSSQPMSAAQCLVSAPPSLKLMDAIYLCMNHTVETTCGRGTCTQNKTISSENENKNLNANMAIYLSSCLRLAPREWPSEDQAMVCKGVRSAAEAEGAVLCAKAVLSSLPGTPVSAASEACQGWRLLNASSVVAVSDTMDNGAAFFGSAAKCIRIAVTSLQTNGRSVAPLSNVILNTCTGATSDAPGSCLAQLVSKWRLTFEDGAVEAFCKSPNALSKIGCIGKLFETRRGSGWVVTRRDAQGCLEVPASPTSAKLLSIWSTNPEHGPEVQSGTRFSVVVRILDQWDQPFVTGQEPVTVHISINTNNPQGAVLWGTRSNLTVANDATGIVRFDNLMISQAGEVKLKVSVRKSSSNEYLEQTSNLRGSSRYSDRMHSDYVVLMSGILNVRINPQLQDALHCGFIFRQGACPNDLSFPSNWGTEFPKESAYFAPLRYLSMLACHSLIVDAWGVELQTSLVDGSSIITYREGVDAMWTGGPGFPTEDMPFLARLELNRTEWVQDLDLLEAAITSLLREEGQKSAISTPSAQDKVKSSPVPTRKQCKRLVTAMQKVLRKAYYRKSLQWHPDRWLAHPLYADAVTRAFELVNEAYEALSSELAALVPPKSSQSTSPELEAQAI